MDTPLTRVTWVLASMIELPERSFMDSRGKSGSDLLAQLGDLVLVGLDRLDQRDVEFGGIGSPWLAPNQGLSVRSPSGAKSRFDAVELHHGGQRRRDMRDVGHHRAGLRARWGSPACKSRSTLRVLCSHSSLASALSPLPAMAPAWPTARVSLAFQRPTTQAITGFLNSRFFLVVPARLDVHHRRLGARVVIEGVGEFGRGEKNIEVLAAGDAGGRAPAARGQIGGDGGGEVAGVRE